MSTDTEYQPINCDDYEYLELACQRRLKLQIQLQDGSEIEVQAEDLVTRKKVEYLIVGTPEGAKELRLDHINTFSHPEIGTIVIDHSH
ncbi:Rho-binding antiterminator [Moellerella wisconsensis]|uniref:Rho-specific transcription termination inhibitor n=3 Tax=Moellerella wisconsensis TaxID=158849 RepID=A0A0N0ZCU9_9GAMM|nr:Rho-binding antiterminator [Moellerella wisconsensis]KLN97628.1 Rho-binding antiterminator [Moellerella wisconsensis]KPD04344.1 Rho-specific transcription termination inhibitor [Moellerella wisconsensis ATCC 35017]UNH24712.1 Rho-binding antiterminator [Moellerella wisconsensis]UNH27818.1 Rho-binding antiterminator [Moellerella wisconsensis]UNH31315.1 Rho-binding antiterminator [Moellerella wisconsensis]